jgi:hypothetical protein
MKTRTRMTMMKRKRTSNRRTSLFHNIPNILGNHLPSPLLTANRPGNKEKDSSNVGTTTTSTSHDKSTPKYCWTHINKQMKKVMIDKTGMAKFVVTSVFPKLKFITGLGINMDYSADK